MVAGMSGLRQTQAETAPPKTAQQLADDHEMRIVRAKQLCRQVYHAGRLQFIAGYCHHDGDAEMVVYLKGFTGSVRPGEITFQEQA